MRVSRCVNSVKELYHYVGAILGKPSTVSIQRQESTRESWQDQGFTVTRNRSVFQFDDDVVVLRIVEQDDFPVEAACAECWIEYEVLSPGRVAGGVEPVRKTFDNACRQSFWLAWHQA